MSRSNAIAAGILAKYNNISFNEAIRQVLKETKENNITANVIIPSVIDTLANRQSMPKADFSKWVKPDVIADKCLELAGDEGKKINGEVIKIY